MVLCQREGGEVNFLGCADVSKVLNKKLWWILLNTTTFMVAELTR